MFLKQNNLNKQRGSIENLQRSGSPKLTSFWNDRNYTVTASGWHMMGWSLVPMCGNIDCKKYTDILDKNLWSEVVKCLNTFWAFQDDTVLTHRSRHTLVRKM